MYNMHFLFTFFKYMIYLFFYEKIFYEHVGPNYYFLIAHVDNLDED